MIVEQLRAEANARDFRDDVFNSLFAEQPVILVEELTSPDHMRRALKEIVFKTDPETNCRVYYMRTTLHNLLTDEYTVLREEVLKSTANLPTGMPDTPYATPRKPEPTPNCGHHTGPQLQCRRFCYCDSCKQERQKIQDRNTELRAMCRKPVKFVQPSRTEQAWAEDFKNEFYAG